MNFLTYYNIILNIRKVLPKNIFLLSENLQNIVRYRHILLAIVLLSVSLCGSRLNGNNTSWILRPSTPCYRFKDGLSDWLPPFSGLSRYSWDYYEIKFSTVM